MFLLSPLSLYLSSPGCIYLYSCSLSLSSSPVPAFFPSLVALSRVSSVCFLVSLVLLFPLFSFVFSPPSLLFRFLFALSRFLLLLLPCRCLWCCRSRGLVGPLWLWCCACLSVPCCVRVVAVVRLGVCALVRVCPCCGACLCVVRVCLCRGVRLSALAINLVSNR